MAFEGYSLYPTVTLRENIAFALKAAKLLDTEVASRVKHVSDMLEITDILDRYPMSVSGGQQQRASLARALIRDVDTAPERRLACAVIGRLADMPIPGAGRIDVDRPGEAVRLQQFSKYSFRGRRATDIAGTDEQHRFHRI